MLEYKGLKNATKKEKHQAFFKIIRFVKYKGLKKLSDFQAFIFSNSNLSNKGLKKYILS